MKRYIIITAIVLLWAISVSPFCVAGQARADHAILFDKAHFGVDYDLLNPAIIELRQTGGHRWNIVQESSGNISGAIIQGLNEWSAEFGVLMVHDPSSPYSEIMSGGTQFIYGNSRHGPCGTWAIECLPDFPYRPHVVYNADVMQVWPPRSIIEVVLHALGHKLGNFAEGYKEAYVYGTASCSGTSSTNLSVMGCGLFNAQFIGAYERLAWALSHIPRQPLGHLDRYDDGHFLYVCGAPANATRVSILYDDGEGDYWAGIHEPVLRDANGCQVVWVSGQLWRCYTAKYESEYSWRYHGGTRLGCLT